MRFLILIIIGCQLGISLTSQLTFGPAGFKNWHMVLRI